MSEPQAGKGDRARNNHSPRFRSNYDEINWGAPEMAVCPDCGNKVPASKMVKLSVRIKNGYAETSTCCNFKNTRE